MCHLNCCKFRGGRTQPDSPTVAGACSVLMYMWSSLAALTRGCCPVLCQKGEDWPHHPAASSHFQWQFEFFWSCDCLLPCPLRLSQKVLDNCAKRYFSQHLRKWPTILVTPSKLCRGAAKAWVKAQHFLKKIQQILVRTHPLFSGTMQDYSGAATHPPSPPYSLPEYHSRCHSAVNRSFTRGLTKPQTYFSFLEQEASFSKGLWSILKWKKAEGESWCPSMAWDLPFQLL